MSKRAEDSPVQRNWFALYTRPRSEFKAEIQLNSIEILNYLPVTTQIKQWSDRKKKVTEPLLRGYIFIYATEKERLISLEQNAVIRCVSERGRAAVIPEDQMNNLRSFIQKEMQYDVYEGLVPGTKIRITHGPFAGV
ncbi:MAG: UpxY family transcription antiterminator, partial [Ignavibacteriales bacterium]|nr:UpxY family transcription antiterminator [Ignavibacteriales bacterium]